MSAEQRLERREELERKVREHERVSRLGLREVGRIEDDLTPRQIAIARRDARKAEMIACTRRIMNYHANLGVLKKKRFRGEAITAEERVAIRQEGRGIEEEFRTVIRHGARSLREDPWFAAHVAAVREAPEFADVWENVPDYFDAEEMEAVAHLGINVDRLHAEWQRIYAGRHEQAMALLDEGKIEQALLRLEQRADGISFPEAPGSLEAEGLLAGGEDVIEVVAAAVAVVVAVVVAPVLAVIVAVIAIIVLLAEEVFASECKGGEVIRLHFKCLTQPKISIDEQVASMKEVLEPNGFQVQEVSRETLDLPHLLDVDVGECLGSTTTDEQHELFMHRNDVGGNDITIYFVRSTIPGYAGCAAHPAFLYGAVVADSATKWTLAHEVGHVLGLPHVDDNDRLMTGNGTFKITNPPPDIVESEKETMCSSDLTT